MEHGISEEYKRNEQEYIACVYCGRSFFKPKDDCSAECEYCGATVCEDDVPIF